MTNIGEIVYAFQHCSLAAIPVPTYEVGLMGRDVPDIWFRLAGYPAIF